MKFSKLFIGFLREFKRVSKLGSEGQSGIFKKILVPLGGYPSELKICNLLLDLAKTKNHKLTFLHVKTPEIEAEKVLSKLEKIIEREEVDARKQIIHGEDVAYEILKEAKKQYNLIAMASRLKILKEEIFGSVVNKVIRDAQCDVLVFHNANKLPKSLSNILVPLFSPNRKAIRLVLEFTDIKCCKDADITFLHIHELPITLPMGTEYIPEENKTETREVLFIVKEESKIGGKTSWIKNIFTRDAKKTLLEYVKRVKPDLLFLPAKKKPRAFFGLLGTDEYYLASRLKLPIIFFF